MDRDAVALQRAQEPRHEKQKNHALRSRRGLFLRQCGRASLSDTKACSKTKSSRVRSKIQAGTAVPLPVWPARLSSSIPVPPYSPRSNGDHPSRGLGGRRHGAVDTVSATGPRTPVTGRGHPHLTLGGPHTLFSVCGRRRHWR